MLHQLTTFLLITVSYCNRWVLTNLKQVFKVDEPIDNQLAEAFFNSSINETGWSFLKIVTNNKITDEQQFYYAGYLEGYLTKDLIDDAYKNFVGTVLNGNPEIPQEALTFVTKQLAWIESHCLFDDTYWRQVCNLISQLRGLYDGYLSKNPFDALDFNHFYYLTNMGDLEDIIPAFQRKADGKLESCNSLIVKVNNQILVGHNTFNIFSLMLRIYKKYEFSLHDKNVKSNLSFSSRPGDLESKDDFYVLRESNMVVVETSLNNWNVSNYDFLKYTTVPTWIRVNVASRLATNGQEWSQIFQKFRSGTHNNQWMIVDYKDNHVQLVEESFYLYKSKDITRELLEKDGYVASFNVAYDQEIYARAQYSQGWKFNYFNDPRAVQFKEFSQKIQTIDDLGKVIRMNLNETFDLCGQAISPRCDLLTEGAFPFGGIDAKLVNKEMILNGHVKLISSPSYQSLEAFNWAKFEDVPHFGMQNEWKFPWFNYNEFTFKLNEENYED